MNTRGVLFNTTLYLIKKRRACLSRRRLQACWSMYIYGQMASNGIAVMSYLAAAPEGRAGASEIAEARKLSRPLAAKILTQLSGAGLLEGRSGPGGGYRLALPAEDIRLFDIVKLFEQTDPPTLCPFGEGWCGQNAPCPLHDDLSALLKKNREFLENTRLSAFRGHPGAGSPA